MPEFGTPFSGLAKDRKLTHEELIRAIRFMVAAEYEPIQLYMQLAESTDSKLHTQFPPPTDGGSSRCPLCINYEYQH